MCRISRKIDCLAVAATGPTVVLSLSYLVISPIFLIVASILDMKRPMQNLRVGATGTGSDLGFCLKRRLQSHKAAKSSRRLKLNNDAQI